MITGADRLRPGWETLPADLRSRILDAIGGSYVADEPAHGGFSAGYAGVVETSAGRAFVKACAPDWHADSRHFIRQEMETLALLPRTIAPTVAAAIDDSVGTALVMEAIDGRHPGTPWTIDDLHAIAEVLALLAATPAPVGLAGAEDRLVPGFTRWRDIAADTHLLGGLPQTLHDRMPDLLHLETSFRAAVTGDVIVHDDVRADNILIRDGRAHLLDWPHARRGAAWIDVPGLLPSIEASGGPRCEDAWRIFEEHGAPSAEELLAVTSGFASYFWFWQGQPEIPELPGLRAFQRAQAVPALRWLATML